MKNSPKKYFHQLDVIGEHRKVIFKEMIKLDKGMAKEEFDYNGPQM